MEPHVLEETGLGADGNLVDVTPRLTLSPRELFLELGAPLPPGHRRFLACDPRPWMDDPDDPPPIVVHGVRRRR